MPELLRDIASRLREFVGNRRRAHRYPARLHIAVSLVETRQRAHPITVEGHTRDLSNCGVGLILPVIRIEGKYLTGDSHVLRITLQLPNETIQFDGIPVRYERLEENDTDRGYLVGVRIKDIGEKAREAFEEYLRTIAT